MFKLDDNLLRELGLGSLPAHEKNRMLGHIYETLEMRVGMKLAERMTNQQLDEFEAFIDRNDEAGALKWLETNFPNYKQVVAEQLEALKNEIKVAAPQIVAASQAQPMAQPTQAGVPPVRPPGQLSSSDSQLPVAAPSNSQPTTFPAQAASQPHDVSQTAQPLSVPPQPLSGDPGQATLGTQTPPSLLDDSRTTSGQMPTGPAA